MTSSLIIRTAALLVPMWEDPWERHPGIPLQGQKRSLPANASTSGLPETAPRPLIVLIWRLRSTMLQQTQGNRERQAAVAHKAALNNAPRPAVDKRASSTDPKAPAAHNAPQDADAFFIGTPAFLTRGVLGPNQYHPNSNNPAAGPPATSSNNQVQGRRKNPDEDVSHVAPPKRKHGDI
ncbi:hypothetical protein PspLS_01714 [Pyricularia sp. CBS 133598]|nr:hypothetical protein PspLS_01714 [Pyricularia sp. CBS 133598]